MTPLEGSPPPPDSGGGDGRDAGEGGGGGAGGGRRAKLSAAKFLGPVLLAHIEAVRADARRVVATSAQGEGAEPDVEAVHDFRVSLRRLRTLLKPARRIYGKRRLRPIADGLREFARATGALRDEEVLRETLTALELDDTARAAVGAWVARRSRREHEARARIVELLRRDRPGDADAARGEATEGAARGEATEGAARGEATEGAATGSAAPADVAPADDAQAGVATGSATPANEAPTGAAPTDAAQAGEPAPGAALRLEPHLARLERRISRKKAKRRKAEALARRAIDEALRDVRALAGSDPDDGAAMHALRIRFKRLRYSAETFSPLFGERAERTARSSSRLQRRLGQLHDVDEALAQMRDAEGLSPDERSAVVEALRAERARIASKATSELAQELEALATTWSETCDAPPSR